MRVSSSVIVAAPRGANSTWLAGERLRLARTASLTLLVSLLGLAVFLLVRQQLGRAQLPPGWVPASGVGLTAVFVWLARELWPFAGRSSADWLAISVQSLRQQC